MGLPYNAIFDINFGLAGKKAIVTGAASGIGEAIARMFVKKGANVAMVDKNESVHEVAKAILSEGSGSNGGCGDNGGNGGCGGDSNGGNGGNGGGSYCDGICSGSATSVVGDITDRDFRAGIVNIATGAFGGNIDILVNCAGIALLDEAEDLSEEYWDKTMDVNLKAAFMLSQTIGRHMMQHKGGKIINIASQASVVALDRHVAYCASKAALVSVTQTLAAEWAEYGINVNAISPTVVLTELGKRAWAGDVGEAMKKLIPANRFGYPDEIAACASYLASDAANLITGANIIIDGGFTIK